MGNQVIILHSSILVLEMQVLGCSVFEKVTPLQAFCHYTNFLRLGSWDVANVELVSSWALVLITVVSNEVWSAHNVILHALHQSRRRSLS